MNKTNIKNKSQDRRKKAVSTNTSSSTSHYFLHVSKLTFIRKQNAAYQTPTMSSGKSRQRHKRIYLFWSIANQPHPYLTLTKLIVYKERIKGGVGGE